MTLFKVFFKNWLPAALLCGFGLHWTFHSFWMDFDSITGDLIDSRFIALVLEHTWLWLNGVHQDLFQLPMYFPHQNIYAYSEYFFAVAPLYWIFRFLDVPMLHAYQGWIILCCVLNFACFFWFARKVFSFRPFLAALGAYVFAFSLPRLMQFVHAQLIPQFFIVLSAYGLWSWWKTPSAKRAPAIFFVFGALQLISSFYFLWFWVWVMFVYGVFIALKQDRRRAFREWCRQVQWSWVAGICFLCVLIVGPFLYHYLLAAKEMGFRNWLVIVEGVPRAYSWIALPTAHWQWSWLPLKDWILSIRGLHEQYLSFGLVTWTAMIAGLVQAWRSKDNRWLAVPVIAMFLCTITSGRYSTWVFVAYFTPGGRAIRSVSRIQVFMLLFWAVLFIQILRAGWSAGARQQVAGKQSSAKQNRVTWKKAFVLIWIGMFFLENAQQNASGVFSAQAENARIESMVSRTPADCDVLYFPAAFAYGAAVESVDSIRVAFRLNKPTLNGLTGQTPHDYIKIFYESSGPDLERIDRWMQAYRYDYSAQKLCAIGP